jgi:hypothetical protein
VDVIIRWRQFSFLAINYLLFEKLDVLENGDEVDVDEHLILVRKHVSDFNIPKVFKSYHVYQRNISQHSAEWRIL